MDILATADDLDLCIAFPGPRPLAAEDIDLLLAELAWHADPRQVRRYCLGGVHCGAISAAELTRLVFGLAERVPALTEVHGDSSIDCAALTLNARDLALFRGLGFHRLVARCPASSDLDGPGLSQALAENLAVARAAGMHPVVLDLDHRNLDKLGDEGLDAAVASHPDQVWLSQRPLQQSWHPLAPLLHSVPGCDGRNDIFHAATRRLRGLGYHHVGLHRWALDPATGLGDPRDWLDAEGRLGIGPGARRHLAWHYSVNPADLGAWREQVRSGVPPQAVEVDAHSRCLLVAAWQMLSEHGLDLQALEALDGGSAAVAAWAPALERMLDSGAARRTATGLQLTAMGTLDLPRLLAHMLASDLQRQNRASEVYSGG